MEAAQKQSKAGKRLLLPAHSFVQNLQSIVLKKDHFDHIVYHRSRFTSRETVKLWRSEIWNEIAALVRGTLVLLYRRF